MDSQIKTTHCASRGLRAGISVVGAVALSACVNYAGIHGDQQIAEPQQYATQQSVPAEGGRWPAANWADQFGDAQLRALIDEALRDSPTIAQASARVAAAAAYSETAKAATLPRADASYSYMREQLSGSSY